MNTSLRNATCLVTGASGFIGSHLTRLLVAQGTKVRVLVRRTSHLTPLQGLPIEFVYGDITHPDDCQRALEGIDYLFHVAGEVELERDRPEILFRINRDGVRFMLEAALTAKTKRVVLTSSVAAIGPSRTTNLIDETAGWNDTLPHTPYARSKYEGERIALELAQKGLPLVVVNPSLVIGSPDEGPSIGGKFLLAYLKRRFKAYIRLTFNCVDVEDVAAGHLLALLKGKIGERYILCERNFTLKEFLGFSQRFSGIPVPRLEIPYGVLWGAGAVSECLSRLTRRPFRLTLEKIRLTRCFGFYSNEKARRELGWSPRPLEETLPKTLVWLKQYHLSK